MIQDVRSRVANARRELPRALEPPTVSKMDQGDQPILWIPFNSTRPTVETSEYVKRQIKPLMETIDGVGGIEIFGPEEVKAHGYNLDVKNPHAADEDYGDPEKLLEKLAAAEAQAVDLRDQLKAILAEALLR